LNSYKIIYSIAFAARRENRKVYDDLLTECNPRSGYAEWGRLEAERPEARRHNPRWAGRRLNSGCAAGCARARFYEISRKAWLRLFPSEYVPMTNPAGLLL